MLERYAAHEVGTWLKSKKSGMGISIVGFSLAVLGFIFLVGGKLAIGLPFVGAGVVFIVVGVGAARKAPPPNGRTGR